MENIHVNVSGKPYTNKNITRLNDCLKNNSFKTSVWGTSKQFKKQGLIIKQDELSKVSIHYPKGQDKDKKMRFATYKVFNLCQTEFKNSVLIDEFETPTKMLKTILDTHPEIFI